MPERKALRRAQSKPALSEAEKPDRPEARQRDRSTLPRTFP